MSALLAAGAVRAEPGALKIERFSASTTAMTPRDVQLRIDVREWSDDAARAAVLAALGSDAQDVQKALAELPSIGYVWQNGSPVGYSVKYAHRAPAAQGERITFVTDKRLGGYERKPWAADQPAGAAPDMGYSVIELYLDAAGAGVGTLSLAAEVKLDEGAGLVSLAEAAPQVLANATAVTRPD